MIRVLIFIIRIQLGNQRKLTSSNLDKSLREELISRSQPKDLESKPKSLIFGAMPATSKNSVTKLPNSTMSSSPTPNSSSPSTSASP